MFFEKAACVFVSLSGRTRQVALRLQELRTFDVAREKIDVEPYQAIVFCCPTYGDEELPLAMEDFLEALAAQPKLFTVCELGNYFGYERSPFGALPIIRNRLTSAGWTEFFPSVSVDAFPRIDWNSFLLWRTDLYEVLRSV